MYTYKATVARVIDGDTVVLDIDLGFRTIRKGEVFRMARINAPEMSTEEGKRAKLHLEALLRGCLRGNHSDTQS